jgi:hypothetical protein
MHAADKIDITTLTTDPLLSPHIATPPLSPTNSPQLSHATAIKSHGRRESVGNPVVNFFSGLLTPRPRAGSLSGISQESMARASSATPDAEQKALSARTSSKIIN